MYALSWTIGNRNFARVGNAEASGATRADALKAAARIAGPMTPAQRRAFNAALRAANAPTPTTAPRSNGRRRKKKGRGMEAPW